MNSFPKSDEYDSLAFKILAKLYLNFGDPK